VRPVAHIWTAHKASWFEITDNLPQHAESPKLASATRLAETQSDP
jgi:hypothetical protein